MRCPPIRGDNPQASGRNSFQNMVLLHIKLNGIKNAAIW